MCGIALCRQKCTCGHYTFITTEVQATCTGRCHTLYPSAAIVLVYTSCPRCGHKPPSMPRIRGLEVNRVNSFTARKPGESNFGPELRLFCPSLFGMTERASTQPWTGFPASNNTVFCYFRSVNKMHNYLFCFHIWHFTLPSPQLQYYSNIPPDYWQTS